jgi:hypothetical protein
MDDIMLVALARKVLPEVLALVLSPKGKDLCFINFPDWVFLARSCSHRIGR